MLGGDLFYKRERVNWLIVFFFVYFIVFFLRSSSLFMYFFRYFKYFSGVDITNTGACNEIFIIVMKKERFSFFLFTFNYTSHVFVFIAKMKLQET